MSFLSVVPENNTKLEETFPKLLYILIHITLYVETQSQLPL